MTSIFGKPPFSIGQQISLLQQRGVIIQDIPLAEHILTHVGYYRLAGYWQIFQYDFVKHLFHAGTTFESILDFYNFDRELRLLVYDAIERVEISFRSVLVHQMCMSYGPNWYCDAPNAQDNKNYSDNLAKIDEELARTKEEFMRHHDKTYGNTTYPPAWKTMQVLSFGTLSKVYSNINNLLPEKNMIAKSLGLPNYTYLVSWMQSVSILRNFCAHHSRICNRKFDFPPKKMPTSAFPWIINIPQNNLQSQELYYQLCALKFLLDRSTPSNHFSQKLQALETAYAGINLPKIGFPKAWKSEPLWQ